ncbi:MAG TPA: hypothetical protein VMU07_00605 [Candidatus Paceibacterota bacterium]|nr:hypothetical protein [Candidatus Paceibacterota bacterium]
MLAYVNHSKAAISLVQITSVTPTSGTSCVLPAITVTPGDWLAVSAFVANASSTGLSISDTASDTFRTATITSSSLIGTGVSYALYYVESAAGGITTTTISGSVSNPPACMEAEYAGISLANSLDQQNVSIVTTQSTTLTTGNITTTLANELLIAIAGETGSPSYTAGASYTIEASTTKSAFEDRIVTATGTYTAGMTTAATSKYIFGIFSFAGGTTTTYQEIAYRWFNNANSLQVGSALAAQNASATLSSTGAAFRLRMLIRASAATGTAGVDQLKLQVATTSGSCSSALTFTDVATSSGNIRFNTNAGASYGSLLTTTSSDPTDGGASIVTETYNDQNPFVVTSTISPGADGKWDFSLIDFSSPASTTYCFRPVKSDGTALAGYTNYPQITSAPPSTITISGMLLNGGSSIVLTPNATTTVTVTASTTDVGGTITSATSTFFRSGVGSTCTADDLNCYQVSASGCTFSNNSTTVSCSANIWYFAQPTDSSSSFSGQTWKAAISVIDNTSNVVTTSTPSGVVLNTMAALNITTSTASYGSIAAGANTSSTNQVITVVNAGNATATLQLNGTALTLGANTIATSSEHYATTTFTFGGSEQALSSTAASVSGFQLIAPPANTTSGWTNTTPLPQPLELFGAAAYNNNLYIVGGGVAGGSTTSTTYIAPFNSDGTIGSFATSTPLPNALSQFGDLIVYNGFMYAIGGAAPSGATSTVSYAPINSNGTIGAWTQTSPLPAPRAVLGTAQCGGYLYAIGGSTQGGGGTGTVSTTFYAQINGDGSVGAWTSTTALPNTLQKLFPISENGYIYIFGGQPVNNTVTTTVLYAPCNGNGTITSWLQGTPLEYGIEGGAVAANTNFAFILGGDSTGSGGDSSTVSYVPLSSGGMTGQGGKGLPILPQKGVSRNAGVINNSFLYTIGGKPPSDTTTIGFMQIPQQNMFWGIQIPSNQPTGTYSGTVNYTAVFSAN